METYILTTIKGILIVLAIGAIFYAIGFAAFFLFSLIGSNIGYLALIPTSFLLCYLIGQGFTDAKKKIY